MSSSKQSKAAARSSRTSHAQPELPSPVLSGYQSSPEDTRSYQPSYQSFGDRARSPAPPMPDARVTGPPQITRAGLRKSRQMQTFNMMVLGAKASGKTTFLHTLVGTLVPSLPAAAATATGDTSALQPPQVTIMPTGRLVEKQVGVVCLSGEKVALNIIDTSGLDIQSNDEFRVDLQMNEALRYIEDKFDESLHVERQVHRNPTRLGDSHVHVAVYFIDPSTITRRRKPSASICSHHERELSKSTIDAAEEEHMSGIDLRQLKRLSRRTTVLPVIARADELTELELARTKEIIRRDIQSYGIELGIFEQRESDMGIEEESEDSEHPEVTTASSTSSKSEPDDQGQVRRRPRKAASLPGTRRARASIVGSLSQELEDVCGMVPLSVIGAEVVPSQPLDGATLDRLNEANPLPGKTDGNLPAASIYVRKFRWATVDVLNPNHCEFLLLRAVLLGSHLSKLKEATRLDKYEKYRTEKLMARRVTIAKGPVGLEEQRKLAIEVDRIEIPHIENPGSIFGGRSGSRPASSTSGIVGRAGSKRTGGARTLHPQAHSQYALPTRGVASEEYHQPRHHSHHHGDSFTTPMVF